MSGVFRRCGCRDGQGRTYGVLPERPTEEQRERACPQMTADPKHGRWSFRLSAGKDPVTKKRRQVNGGTYPTKREAQQERNKAALKIDQGKVLSVSRETLADYLPRWLERRSKVGLKGAAPLRPSTLENYRRYVTQDIAPSTLGSMQVREVRRRHVQAFVDALVDEGRGAVTVRRIVAVLQGAFQAAVRDELIDETPARDLELPRPEKKDFEPWEATQVGQFLDVAGTHRLGALFELVMFTGLRRGEVIGLRWDEHVDLARRELTIRNNRTRTGDGDTKTAAGRRRVPLDDRAVGALVAWQIAQAAEALAAGDHYEESGYVFTMEDGRPLKPQYVTRLFEKLRVQAALPRMTFHGQRHQSASLMLASGADLTIVSKLLGHSDTAVTGDLYSHLLSSKAREIVAGASALVPSRRAPAHTPHTHAEIEQEEAASTSGGNGL
ncbi:Integrase [Nocardioides sp. AX2bis]|nr:Integrase [Nocardioides sp. AX2bis]